jgi:hypothetical protein
MNSYDKYYRPNDKIKHVRSLLKKDYVLFGNEDTNEDFYVLYNKWQHENINYGTEKFKVENASNSFDKK